MRPILMLLFVFGSFSVNAQNTKTSEDCPAMETALSMSLSNKMRIKTIAEIDSMMCNHQPNSRGNNVLSYIEKTDSVIVNTYFTFTNEGYCSRLHISLVSPREFKRIPIYADKIIEDIVRHYGEGYYSNSTSIQFRLSSSAAPDCIIWAQQKDCYLQMCLIENADLQSANVLFNFQ